MKNCFYQDSNPRVHHGLHTCLKALCRLMLKIVPHTLSPSLPSSLPPALDACSDWKPALPPTILPKSQQEAGLLKQISQRTPVRRNRGKREVADESRKGGLPDHTGERTAYSWLCSKARETVPRQNTLGCLWWERFRGPNANPIKTCRKGNFNQGKTNGLAACPFLWFQNHLSLIPLMN